MHRRTGDPILSNAADFYLDSRFWMAREQGPLTFKSPWWLHPRLRTYTALCSMCAVGFCHSDIPEYTACYIYSTKLSFFFQLNMQGVNVWIILVLLALGGANTRGNIVSPIGPE